MGQTRITRLALLAALVAPSALADRIVLQDGREFFGDVRKTETEYVITLKNGIKTKFPIADVAKWEQDSAKPPSTPGGDAASSTVPTPPTTPPAVPGDLPVGPPPGQPKADPTMVLAKSNQSFMMGLKAFQAGDPDASYENFLDSYQVMKANGQPIDPNNPVHASMLNCLTASSIAKGDYPHAAFYVEEAMRSKLRDHATLVNSAIIDYVQHVNSLRAVKNLTPFLYQLSDAEIPNHEMEINVFSANIEWLTRDERNFENPIYKHGFELDAHLRNILQKSHPNQIEWAGKWLPREEGRALRTRFAAEMAAWKASIVAAEGARQAMQAADSNYQNVRSRSLIPGTKRSAGDQMAVESAYNALQKATAAYNNVKNEPDKLKKKIDWPEWPPFVPAKPDVNAAMAALTAPGPKWAINREAVAVPVAPDLALTSANVLSEAKEITVTDAMGNVRHGTVVRKDGVLGLALVRMVEGPPLRYLNLATQTTAGQFAYWGFPDVPVQNPIPAAVNVSALSPKNATWSVTVSGNRQPRLAGAAVVDKLGTLVGIVLGERVMPSAVVPAVPIEQVRAFIGNDLPKTPPSPQPMVTDVLQLRASH